MSDINGKHASIWIYTNHPQDGLFRVYWKNADHDKDPLTRGATLDSEEGGGLRYEWEYKDGERVDGISRGWYPNGNKKSETIYKDGKQIKSTVWHENGQKERDGILNGEVYVVSNIWDKNGDIMVKNGNGLYTTWFKNGQKRTEGTFKDGKGYGLWTRWYESGQKKSEGNKKDGKQDGLYTRWSKDGYKIPDETYRGTYDHMYKGGELINQGE